MTANVGSIDRIIRFIIGAALIALPYLMPDMAIWANPMVKYGANAVGAILILTGLFSFCPLFKILGINSRQA
jgi:rhamnose utilization protein RhaD (predicted bifunctional aldolase and dehydrogenase)